MVFVFDSWKFVRQRLIASGAALKPGGRLVFIAMEEGERAVDLSGSPVTSFIPNRRSARNIFSASGYAIETVDDTAMPHHTAFILTPKPRPPAAPRTADDILKELRSAQAYEPERDRREQTDTSLDAIGLTRGMRVAEVGAGAGYLVEKLVRRVGPEGRVYAEDIGAEQLDVLRLRMAERHLPNVEVILGKATDPRLPAKTLDMVVISTTMHLVDAPVELFRNIAPSLKPGGKLVLIEWERGRAMSPDGETATDTRYRTRAQFLAIFEQSGFKVDRIDTTATPYRVIFVLSPARAEDRQRQTDHPGAPLLPAHLDRARAGVVARTRGSLLPVRMMR
jgi:SAM-dependent methyltransferase